MKEQEKHRPKKDGRNNQHGQALTEFWPEVTKNFDAWMLVYRPKQRSRIMKDSYSNHDPELREIPQNKEEGCGKDLLGSRGSHFNVLIDSKKCEEEETQMTPFIQIKSNKSPTKKSAIDPRGNKEITALSLHGKDIVANQRGFKEDLNINYMHIHDLTNRHPSINKGSLVQVKGTTHHNISAIS